MLFEEEAPGGGSPGSGGPPGGPQGGVPGSKHKEFCYGCLLVSKHKEACYGRWNFSERRKVIEVV